MDSNAVFVEIYIENPVLVGMLSEYRTALEEYGFEFSSDGCQPSILRHQQTDALPLFTVPKDLSSFAEGFVEYLLELDYFDLLGPDEAEAMADNLTEQTRRNLKSINRSYQCLSVSCNSIYDDRQSCTSLKFDGSSTFFRTEEEPL